MNAISLASEPKSVLIAGTAQASLTRPMTTSIWYLTVTGLGVWSAIVAALLSNYIHPALRVHDEFSYILAGDTILHGRLANPTPPVWEALQSFHTVMHPSYASKYPVGSGLLVAVGLLFGMPLASSWLAMALMTVCVTWMLAGTLPKRWAILGGVFISLCPFIQLAWSQSLLHGFLPASGSALLMGGILRLRRRVAFSSALASGCGVGLLAISRPFEGLCCTIISAAILWFAWNRHSLTSRTKMAMHAGALAAPPVLAALILIAAHNQAVTGNWRVMPYQLHESQYGVAPLFVFASPKLENTGKRPDLPAVFHDYHAVDSLSWYQARIGLNGWIQGVSDAARELFELTFPIIGVLAIAGLGWTKLRFSKALVLAIGIQVAASACVCWVYSHYLAPIVPWLLLVSLLALRQSLRGRISNQRQVVRLTVLAVLIVQVACLGTFAGVARTNEMESWSSRRQAIVEQLTESEGKHLVLVRYSAEHNVHQEWVYNLAEPRESKIVWARFEDGRWISSLLREYPGRFVWVIDADDPNPVIKQYSDG